MVVDVIRRGFLLLLSLLFVAAGINHFVHPDFYVSIMPPWIPWHHQLVALSGVIEVALGIAVVVPSSRKLAGWMLIVMLIAFIPVHIHMATHPEQFADFAYWKILLRLPMQALLIAWVYWVAIASVRQHRVKSTDSEAYETIEPKKLR